jgi:EF hand
VFSDSQLRSQDRPKSHPKAPEQAPRFGQRWNRRQAKAAAGALFDKLNTDKDNTIDTKELQGRVSKKDLAANDPDKDNALTKEKYLALVAARFKAADPDSDGKLDAKELATPAGKDLVRLCMSETGRRRNFAGGRRWR